MKSFRFLRGNLHSIAIIGSLLSVGPGVLPVQAQLSDIQVGKVVEALRQAAPDTGKKNDGLYSDWQVKPDNIPRWSKNCTGRELSPTEFEANPTAARSVVTCIIRDVLRDEYRVVGNNELVAVRRVAAWWMTGDAGRYRSADISPYIEKVVSFYQQPAGRAPLPATNSSTNSKGTLYDRYMQAAYTATQQKDNQTALLYFRRALDERPNDTFATQAIRNVEANRPNKPKPAAEKPIR
ncbi:hypothetical protein ACKFKG_25120 [Phormidesmis sp. 146-35]